MSEYEAGSIGSSESCFPCFLFAILSSRILCFSESRPPIFLVEDAFEVIGACPVSRILVRISAAGRVITAFG